MKTKSIALIIALIMPFIASATSAADALSKAATKLSSAKSITATFTGSTAGTLVVSGSNFTMTTGDFGVWYNGTDMWTYNKAAGETSLTTPTKAELVESNPMEVIKGAKSTFTATKVSESGGKITVKLTPKSKNSGVKTATLVINTSTWMPVTINVTFSNNQNMVFNITSITEGSALPAGNFAYPKAKYPGVEVIDLR